MLLHRPPAEAFLQIKREAAADPAGCNLVSGASVYLEGLSQQQRGRWEGRASYLCDRKGLDTSDSTSGVWLLRFCPVFQQCGENEGLFRIVDPGS